MAGHLEPLIEAAMKPTFVRPATLEDAISVASRLRPEDRDEVLAASGADPKLVFPEYVKEDRLIFAAGMAFDGIPEILWGADPIPFVEDACVGWLVTTPRIYEYPLETAIQIKRLFEELHKDYALITNFTDARNTKHHKLIEWLGCKPIRRIEKFGAHSLPFIEFASYRPRCA
jgi:hypothetical protein